MTIENHDVNDIDSLIIGVNMIMIMMNIYKTDNYQI